MSAFQASSETPTSQASVRGRNDPAWEHATEIVMEGVKQIKCLYCGKVLRGGGINRLKQHLAEVKGEVAACRSVGPDVRHQMKNLIEKTKSEKQKRQRVADQFIDPYPAPRVGGDEEEDEDVQVLGSQVGTGRGKGVEIPRSDERASSGGKGNEKIDEFFAPRTTAGSQPGLKSFMVGKKAIDNAYVAFGRWMYDAAIPFNAVNSAYFQPALDAIAAIRPGVKGPNVHDLRGWILKKNVEEVKEIVSQHRIWWAQYGCSIMADGWTDQRGRTLINFLVHSCRGTVFLRSVDASSIVKTSAALFELLKEVVEEVGPQNVVQIVTDNAANYVAAGGLIHEEYPTIFWSPCAAHCIDLMLEDIGKLPLVDKVVRKARLLTKFIYNHAYVLNMMRDFTKRELVRPAITRFATHFLTLQSIHESKTALRNMFCSARWLDSTWSKKDEGIRATDFMTDNRFWSDLDLVIHATVPLVQVLRMVDGEAKPAMGYIYEGMDRAKDAIKVVFKRKPTDYMPYWTIIDKRWDKQLHRALRAAGCFLNPSIFYSDPVTYGSGEVYKGFLDCLETMIPDESRHDSIFMSVMRYKDGDGSFGRKMALRQRNLMQPHEWWRNFGIDDLELQNLTIRILSQTCSSSGCERNWSVFERIHTKRRNRLEHKRLNDLIYTHYNLRLKERQSSRKSLTDPISLENIDLTDDWVVEAEDDDAPLLDVDEIDDWMDVADAILDEGEGGAAAGNTRRLQPCKPATKAQAAVALTSGRMEDAVNTEISRLETENSLREAQKEEIKAEFLLKGEIQVPWEKKLSEEKARGLQVEEAFRAILHELENENIRRDESHTAFLKGKAALDCHWQLLLNLKEEVDGMSRRLTSERADFLMEQQTLEELFIDFQAKKEAIVDAKSILEAEKEAVRILRSWVEEEARRSQTRAKLLEEAVKRWKWDDCTCSSENGDS